MRTSDKLEKCREFGLDEAILTDKNTDFAKIVRDKTNGKGVDVILDLVGASFFAENLKSLALKGRLILVGLTGGATVEFNLGMALAKRAKIVGTVLRSRSTEEKAKATAKFVKDVLPLIVAGKIKPNLDKVFSVESIKEAHEYLESNRNFGKVVLEFQTIFSSRNS